MEPVWVPDPWHWVLYLESISKLHQVPPPKPSCPPTAPHPVPHTCWRAAGMVMIFWIVLPSLSM